MPLSSFNAPVLQVDQLSIKVKDSTIVDNISFKIAQGEILALVGESGSGKSLTSLAIMRLLPDALKVTGGAIFYHEKNLFELSEVEMQRVRGNSVAMIFQEPMTSLNPVMKVGEQVAEVIRLHQGASKKVARKKVEELFAEVGIPEPSARYDWYPHQLSGGQKQRVMIAMALACEPEVLIADEPTTALDVTIQAQVLNLLLKLRETRNIAILFITHDMGVVNEVADRVAVMRKGRLVEVAAKKTFFREPEHYYSQKLLADAVPSLSLKPQTETEKLLELKGLKVHFPIKKGIFQRTVGHVKAVDGVDLVIEKGKTLALVGESGSGKSTIGQAILKLVKASDGQINLTQGLKTLNLATLSEGKMRPLRKVVQVIFQDPFSALNPRMTIADIIKEGMQSLTELTKVQQELRVKELLKQVDLDEAFADRYPHELSGGQRQRIGIARALAVKPELIICDEPTSALDVSVRAQVLELLADLQREYQLSYLFITHDLSIVPSIADKVAVMQSGKIVEQGTVAEVMHQPQHEYTQSLLASAPKLVRDVISRSQTA